MVGVFLLLYFQCRKSRKQRQVETAAAATVDLNPRNESSETSEGAQTYLKQKAALDAVEIGDVGLKRMR